MPNYAALLYVLREAQRRLQSFQPRYQLDFGTGPGAFVWAASVVFPSLENIIAVEHSEPMMEVGKFMTEGIQKPERMLWQSFFETTSKLLFHDLITMSFVLSEISPGMRQDKVQAMWKQCTGMMMIVEPGTPLGFSLVLEAQKAVLELKDQEDPPVVLAPCPHSLTCPMTGTSSWCHMTQKYWLLNTEDQGKPDYTTLSYVILCRSSLLKQNNGGSTSSASDGTAPEHELPEVGFRFNDALKNPQPRLILPLMTSNMLTIADLCHKDGTLKRHIITRRWPSMWRWARIAKRGDLCPASYDDELPKPTRTNLRTIEEQPLRILQKVVGNKVARKESTRRVHDGDWLPKKKDSITGEWLYKEPKKTINIPKKWWQRHKKRKGLIEKVRVSV
eukprot:NODE_613_length_1562_cov_65.808328_g504_i0.p1 GENE.NODE_613_length_1562_cov_65.808328_g504_i0~~NODE_613_length_1562_cov_65.808328_g504_i0.p1  ORF type:complete len:389 (+),score=82.86 NODE_613_length_1562_cov_65.808328_g504_i0:337-1503(+)